MSLDHDSHLLLPARDAARALGISPRLLWTYSRGLDPIPTVRIGRRVLYPLDGLRKWVRKHARPAGSRS